MADAVRVAQPWLSKHWIEFKGLASFGCGKGGHITSTGWQVTLSNPIWCVSSNGGELVVNYAPFTYLLIVVVVVGWAVLDLLQSHDSSFRSVWSLRLSSV